ncbi:MAG: Na+:solute symporter [Porticoccaceae bacterium]|nr:Na+:solute symporter [Porticoccaceae bacterium]
MTFIDWAIVAAYVVIAVAIGLYFTEKAKSSSDDFFVAGRSLPWFIVGTSMVATTFSTDTPLFVAGAVREEGIYANWIWWSAAIGALVSVFFFMHLWRRSRAVTEIEFVIQRYDNTPAMHGLRVFKAVFDGLFINCILMASVTLAMSKIIVVILGLSSDPLFHLPLIGAITPTLLILAILGVAAVIYTAMSGLYGVVYTDLVQFGLAMVGSIGLAVIVYVDLSANGGVMANLKQSPHFTADTLRMFPEFGWNLDTATFLILVTVGWWYLAPGAGFYIQRTLAARSERDAMLGMYWFAICHYVLRSWPWIVVGVASLVYFPGLVDAESSYPEMIHEFLPVGLKGIMVASLLAAFMSTLDTHINWGTSYMINDIYKPYMKPDKSTGHYIKAARICMVLIAIIALVVATQITNLLTVVKYYTVIFGGVSFVLIARWYWWRINVWSEIAGFVGAAVIGNVLLFVLPDTADAQWFGVRTLLNLVLTALLVILVTWWTKTDKPSAQIETFYRRLRVPGAGWKRVKESTGIAPLSANLKTNTIACVASIAMLYSVLLGCGHALFGQWPEFALYAVVAAAAFLVIRQKLPQVLEQLQEEE